MYKYNPKTRKWEEKKTEEQLQQEQQQQLQDQIAQLAEQQANQNQEKKSGWEKFLTNPLGETFDFLGSFIDKGAFEDGFDWTDIPKTIIGTAGKAATEFTKGIWGIGESFGDMIAYGQANLLEKTGLFKDYIDPNDLRESAMENQAEKIWKTPDAFEEWSVTTDRSDGLIQTLGYIYGLQAIGGVTKAKVGSDKVVDATITGTTFSTAMGNGMTEAYENGATNGEALKYGIISGLAEAGSEMMFGGLGKGTNALGLSKGIGGFDDQIASAVSNRFKSRLMKNFSEYAIKASGEGLEEVVSGFCQGLGKKLTYMSDKDLRDILNDEKLLDQFIDGAIASGISSAPSLVKSTKANVDYVDGFSENERKVMESLTEKRRKELMNKKTIESIVDDRIEKAEYNQGSKLNATEKEAIRKQVENDFNNGDIEAYMSDLSKKELSSIKKEVNEQIKSGKVDIGDIEQALSPSSTAQIKTLQEQMENTTTKEEKADIQSKIDKLRVQQAKLINDSASKDQFLQKSYYEANQKNKKYEYDETKIKDENEQFTRKTAAQFMNNTSDSRKIVDIASNLNKENIKYGFTNSEELKKLGHNVENAEINGFVRTNEDGKTTILINTDSKKALNVILGHETNHLFENTAESKDLRDMLFDYAKQKGDYDSRLDQIKELYKGIDGTNIENELAADLVGDYMFTDEKLIESLSKKPNLFTKIKDLIDDLVIKFKGTDDEKKLREIQKKFRDIYQNSDISKQEKKLKFSKGKLISGEDVVISDDLLGSRPSKKDVKLVLTKLIGQKVKNMSSNDYLQVTNNDIKKFMYDGYNNYKSRRLKYRISGNYGEILELAKIDPLKSGKSNYKNTHRGRKGFDYYNVLLAYPLKNNNGLIEDYSVFEGRMVVRKESDGNYAYDIDNINEKRGATIDKNSLSIMVDESTHGSSVEDNISQSNNNVKSSTLSNNSNMQDNIKYSLNNQKLDDSSFPSNTLKEKQLDIILKNNPAGNETVTWIRNIEDIKTLQETIEDDDWADYDAYDPDLTKKDIEKAIENGLIIVYSSYPIEQGIFVSPSRMEAESYAGNGKVYSKEVSINDVAWIDPTQGQYAKVVNTTGIEYNKDRNLDEYKSSVLFNQMISKAKIGVDENLFLNDYNNYYEVLKTADNNYQILSKIPILGNEDFIKNIIEEGKNVDAFRTNINTNIERTEFRYEFDNWNNASVEGEQSWTEYIDSILEDYQSKNISEKSFIQSSKKNLSRDVDNTSLSLSNFGSETKRYEDLNSKKQKDYIEIETNRLIRDMDVDQITYQEIDDIIAYSPYSEENYIDLSDVDLDEINMTEEEVETHNQQVYDDVYSQINEILEKEGISPRYDEGQDKTFFDRQELAVKGYNELLNYLDKHNINYEISKSKEAGYVPSIYIKDAEGNTEFRIANHDNGYVDDFDMTYNESYNHIFSDKDYANWKDNILPILEENIDLSSDENINYSLSNNNDDIAPVGNFNVFGDDVKVQEGNTEIEELLEYVAKDNNKSNSNENNNEKYTNYYSPLEKRRKKVEEKIKRAIAQGTYKGINAATKAANEYVGFSNAEKKSFRDDLRRFMGKTAEQLVNVDTYREIEKIVDKYANREIDFVDSQTLAIKKEIKASKIKVDDNLKNQITDYNEFRKSNFGKLKLGNEGLSIDSLWQELSEEYPYLFNKNIINEVDQLYALGDFMNSNDTVTHKFRLSNYELRQARDKVFNLIQKNSLNEVEIRKLQNELDQKAEKRTREVIREELLEKMGLTVEDISKGDDISAVNSFITDPIRLNEKVFGYEIGQKINDATINRTKYNEAESIRWQNRERAEIMDLGIKARSKESAAVQKYGEKKYVNDFGEYINYGDKELAREFPDIKTQDKIKNAARVIRSKYDTYIDDINEVLVDMGYDAIPKRKDYMRHFNELNDIFSRFGVPFSRQNLNDDLLPTDINGITDQFKPGKSFFASAVARKGINTTYDAITGIDGYIQSSSNLIFHTEDIQRYRTLAKLVRDTFGEQHGMDNAYQLNDYEQEQRIQDMKNHKLSRYAAWLDEQANALAGKKGKIDRGLEEAAGRRVYNCLNAIKSQVGSNMVGFNVRSALTNFVSVVQAMPKVKKLAVIQGTISELKNIVHQDNLADKSVFLTSRAGSDTISKKTWQKISSAGQCFMTATDTFTSNVIWRSKYYELLGDNLSEDVAIKQADDFASRIMGDRTKGATAAIFNSKTLGVFSQFQLEVNNQWQALIHDYKMDIQSGNRTAKSVIFQLGQLVAASFFFDEFFKKLTGSSVMFNPIEMLKKIFWPDDDDKDKSMTERAEEAMGDLIDQLPFASILTGGGRIPISEALPIVELVQGKDQYGNEESRLDILKEALPYYIMPSGYNQLNKIKKGLGMFDEDLPVKGSYTDGGKLRFPVEDIPQNRVQAALFGQYASSNARDYFDQGRAPLNDKQTAEYKELGLPIQEYWDYQDELKKAKATKDENNYEKYTDFDGNVYWYDKSNSIVYDNNYNEINIPINYLKKANSLEQAFDYITSLNLPTDKKEIMFNNVTSKNNTDQYGYTKYINKELNSKGKQVNKTYYYDENRKILYDSKYNVVDASKLKTMKKVSDRIELDNYEQFANYEEFDFYNKNTEKYDFLTKNNISYKDYSSSEDSKSAYDWAYNNQKQYQMSKLVTEDTVLYREYTNNLNNIKSDKYANGKTINGSRKNKIINYINGLDLTYEQKIMLYKMEYPSDDTYNSEIVNYLNNKNLPYDDIKTILEELGMKVSSNGTVRW